MDYSLIKLKPSKRLKLSTNFELCVIWQKDKAEKTRKGSEDGIKSFCKASRIRKDNVFNLLEEYMVFSEERIEIS